MIISLIANVKSRVCFFDIRMSIVFFLLYNLLYKSMIISLVMNKYGAKKHPGVCLNKNTTIIFINSKKNYIIMLKNFMSENH